MTLGDRVVVMKDGVIHQCATPFEVYDRPTNRFVAGFVGTPPMNFFEGKLTREGDRLVFDEGENRLPVSQRDRQRLAPYVDQTLVLGLRPETMTPANGDSGPARLKVQVAVVEPLGDRQDVYCSTPQHDAIVCRVDARVRVEEGAPAEMAVDMDRAHFFEPGEDGRNVTLD